MYIEIIVPTGSSRTRPSIMQRKKQKICNEKNILGPKKIISKDPLSGEAAPFQLCPCKLIGEDTPTTISPHAPHCAPVLRRWPEATAWHGVVGAQTCGNTRGELAREKNMLMFGEKKRGK